MITTRTNIFQKAQKNMLRTDLLLNIFAEMLLIFLGFICLFFDE